MSLIARLSCPAPANVVELSDWLQLNIVLILSLPRFPQLGVVIVPLAALVLSILLTLHDHDQVWISSEASFVLERPRVDSV